MFPFAGFPTKYLKKYSIQVKAYDPLITEQDIQSFGIEQHKQEDRYDAVIIFSPHDIFKELTLDKLKELTTENAILIDLKAFYNKQEAIEKGFYYKSL